MTHFEDVILVSDPLTGATRQTVTNTKRLGAKAGEGAGRGPPKFRFGVGGRGWVLAGALAGSPGRPARVSMGAGDAHIVAVFGC